VCICFNVRTLTDLIELVVLISGSFFNFLFLFFIFMNMSLMVCLCLLRVLAEKIFQLMGNGAS
jgi:hypothetical protein